MDSKKRNNESSFAEELGKCVRWLEEAIKNGADNHLYVVKDGKDSFHVPLLVLVVLFIPLCWLFAILGAALLLCGYRYEFRGPNFSEEDKANQMLNKAADACTSAKEDFKKGYQKENADQ